MTSKDTKNKQENDDSKKENCCPLMDNPKNSVLVVGIIALVVGFALGYFVYGYLTPSEIIVKEIFEPNQTEVAKIKTLMEKIAYINIGEQQTLAVKNVTLEEVIRISFDLAGQQTAIYVSKDYMNILGFEQVESIENLNEQVNEVLALMDGEPEFEEGAQQTETPKVELYVMSYCPYGNQAENGIKDAVLLLAEKIDFEPVYIIGASGDNFNSLHGQTELNQDIREKIIYNLYGETGWVEYVYKVNADCSLNDIETCWKDPATALGFDVEKIETEYNEKYIEIARAEALKTSQNGVSGSPTLLINGKKYSGGRDAESYKNEICAYFTAQPDECNKTLDSAGSASTGNC
ncbi:MAG: hypothetical protein WC501_00135 [Candidatus Micrarchaeia archaeon]